jgi:hypothetical protein
MTDMPQQPGQWNPNQGQPGYPPQGSQPGYGQGPPTGGPGGYLPPPQEPPKKRKTGLILGVVVLVLALIAAGVVFSGVLDKDDETTAEAGEGEIILEAAGEVGADPFAETPFGPAPDPAPAPVEQTAGTVTVAPGTQVASTVGSTPGLYGGTMNKAACDPEAMVAFLAANPDKAQAWVDAMNQDPEVVLPDGSKLTVATIPQYVATLTPVVLQADTRVTNHGYKNGKATTLQSVLQAGSAVLVDAKGVPRVKCFCGNPLRGPEAVTGTPTYTGRVWAGFDPAKVSAVQKSTTVINVFVLKDLKTGKLFDRPAGSTGAKDKPNTGTTATTTTTAPPSGSTTTAPPAATTTTSASSSSPEGTYEVTQQTTTCELNGGTCGTGTSTYTMDVSCSASACIVDFGSGPSTYQRNGDTLTLPSFTVGDADAFTCDGRPVPTDSETTITFGSGGSVTYTTIKQASPVPPSCPRPFLQVSKGSGQRR